VIPGKCECGRTHRRIARITGRTDDMLIINGVNVFPSQVEEVLMRMPEVGTNWLIVVSKDGELDRLTVRTEVQPSMFTDDSRPLNALRERVRQRIQACISIGARVELHEPGSLPVAEGKARRVVDERPQL
jgi:phenylacetate-CoA ligase